MPIARQIADDEERVEHFEDCHIFNAQTTVWIPHPYKDEDTYAKTATDFEMDDMLSDYEIPTPLADHQEQHDRLPKARKRILTISQQVMFISSLLVMMVLSMLNVMMKSRI